MISNLSLLFLAIAKASLLTGLLPGIFLFYVARTLVRTNRVPALSRLRRDETRQPQPRAWVGTHPIGAKFGDNFLDPSSGDGQLATLGDLIPAISSRRATSPSRKVRRSA